MSQTIALLAKVLRTSTTWFMLLGAALPCHAYKLQKATLPAGIVTPDSRVFPVDLMGDRAKELAIVRRNEVAVYVQNGTEYVNVQRLLLPAGEGTAGNR